MTVSLTRLLPDGRRSVTRRSTLNVIRTAGHTLFRDALDASNILKPALARGELNKAADLQYNQIPQLIDKLTDAEAHLRQIQSHGAIFKEEVTEEEIAAVADAIRRSCVGLADPDHPIGAPPGFVGYDEGGQLTEVVRRRPYAVVLLDSIDRAHPDVVSVLLQALDEGRMTDGQGRVASFRNAILIMTSQADAQTLPAELLDRLDDVVTFRPLRPGDVLAITRVLLGRASQRIERSGITLEPTQQALERLCEMGLARGLGARPLRRVSRGAPGRLRRRHRPHRSRLHGRCAVMHGAWRLQCYRP